MKAKFEEMDLKELKEACDRWVFLLTRLENIYDRIEKKTDQCDKLRQILAEEEKDVTELQTGGVKAFFKTVLRNRDELLEKEKLEAAAAGAKYQTAMTELEDMKKQKEQWDRELTGLAGCDEAFKVRYEARKAELESLGGETAQAILTAEERVGAAKNQLKQIREAEAAAESAAAYVSEVEASLSKAESWGMYDMVGGGLIASSIKRGHMNQAESMIPELQLRLRRFSDELDDVSIDLDHQFDHDGFMQFADWFFDGFFVDWTVQKQINSFQSEMWNVGRQISGAQQRLQAMREAAEREIAEAEDALKNSVIGA